MKKYYWKRMLSLVVMFSLVVTLFATFGDITTPANAAGEYDTTEYATPATEEELLKVTRSFAADNWGNSFYKIVGGELYVWGQNKNFALGITEYVDSTNKRVPVPNGEPVKSPVKMPEGTFDAPVEFVSADYNSVVVADADRNLYVWGHTLPSSMGLPAGATEKARPQKIETSGLIEGDIVYLQTSGFMIMVKDDLGNWYVGGKNDAAKLSGMLGIESPGGVVPMTKVNPANLADRLGTKTNGQPREIALIKSGYSSRLYIITDDGNLFVWSKQNNNPHTNGSGDADGTDYTVEPAILTQDQESKSWPGVAQQRPLKGYPIAYISTDDQGNAATDIFGNVWAWGSNHTNRYGPFTNQTPNNNGGYQGNYSDYHVLNIPVKIFNNVEFNKKAVRVYTSDNVTVVLCEDNTVYAMGKNANGMIQPGGDETVDHFTQIFKDISINETIIGVFPNNDGIMCLTKGGNMYFAGDNRTGGAGVGDKEIKPGEYAPVEPSTMPPAQPLTENKASFALQVKDEMGKTFTYVPDPIPGKTTRMRDLNSPAESPRYIDQLNIEAGQVFKLVVYFTDFGKLNTFTLPIRFNPNVVQVVNDSGVRYPITASGTAVTTSTLSGSGIDKLFTNLQWSGGTIIAGAGYPKINNTDGWISIAGESTDHSALISGTVPMFSISFEAIKDLKKEKFSDFIYADKENYEHFYNELDSSLSVTPVGLGYDDASETNGPNWTIRNPSADPNSSAAISLFEFSYGEWPVFSSYINVLDYIELGLFYGSNNTAVEDYTDEADPSVVGDQAYSPAKAINWNNSDVVYTLKVLPQPTNASFPQVNWTYDLASPSTSFGYELEDYIQILNVKDTYIQFKVKEGANFKEGVDKIGKIHFCAQSQQYPKSADIYVVLKSFSAPSKIDIAYSLDNGTTLDVIRDDQTVIYHYGVGADEALLDTEAKTFYVNYSAGAQNKAVIWKLLDHEGNEIDSTNALAKVTLEGTVNGASNEDGVAVYSANIMPRDTTSGDTYVTLHVESLYDAEVYDEIQITVHLHVTKLEWKQNIIRMAVDSDKDLSTYLTITPKNVYEQNLVYTIEDVPTRDPDNIYQKDENGVLLKDEFDQPIKKSEGPYTYASIGGRNGNIISAYEWSTPKEGDAGFAQYVKVRVTDTITGCYSDVNVCIMDLDCPIPMDKFLARNNLATANDVLTIADGLQVGDELFFYATFDAADHYMKVGPLEEVQTPSYNFKVGDATKSLFLGQGGEIGVVLKRMVDGSLHEYQRVPVTYSAEPSTVQGYVRLLGRDPNSSYNADIRIDLVGGNHQETVYTNSTGYFKFTQYIPAGTYTLTISKANYLTRIIEPDPSKGYEGLVIKAVEEFNISTYDNPIYLYPGELNGDNAITIQDISYYVSTWVGVTNTSIPNFSDYDFTENNKINTFDLELILMRKDWVRKSYPNWTIATTV